MNNGSTRNQEDTKAVLLRISAFVEGAPYVLSSDKQPDLLAAASCITDSGSGLKRAVEPA